MRGRQESEVRLHRAPCNEIGTTTLSELEQLAEWIRQGANGARALLIYSDQKAGFCAGADLRELYTGMQERRGASIEHLRHLGGTLGMHWGHLKDTLGHPGDTFGGHVWNALGTP